MVWSQKTSGDSIARRDVGAPEPSEVEHCSKRTRSMMGRPVSSQYAAVTSRRQWLGRSLAGPTALELELPQLLLLFFPFGVQDLVLRPHCVGAGSGAGSAAALFSSSSGSARAAEAARSASEPGGWKVRKSRKTPPRPRRRRRRGGAPGGAAMVDLGVCRGVVSGVARGVVRGVAIASTVASPPGRAAGMLLPRGDGCGVPLKLPWGDGCGVPRGDGCGVVPPVLEAFGEALSTLPPPPPLTVSAMSAGGRGGRAATVLRPSAGPPWQAVGSG
mmetsp:Transcript_118525/g.264998  ORF Transcript_118525/g.264998 Transcript_118525/m.264998 type:complete len:273 (-) Transcript_118525:1167-1985(-)